MPRIRKQELLKNNVIDLFNYESTKKAVLLHFQEYHQKRAMIDVIESSYSSSLSNDNMGIFSSKISDPTGQKGTKCIQYKEYIESFDATLRPLKLKLTSDEKVILEKSILTRHSDEDIASALSLDKSNLYPRKKSCFIKVALYYGIEVYK